MANPAGGRAVRLKWPRRVGLRLLCVTLALTGVLFAGCGSGDDRAKVEASLQHYLDKLSQPNTFPIGAGVPRVRENSCKKIQMPQVPRAGILRRPSAGLGPARNPEGLSGWSCVVTFGNGKTGLPVTVALKGSGEVYWAAPMGPALPPATVYEGGP